MEEESRNQNAGRNQAVLFTVNGVGSTTFAKSGVES